MDIVLYGEFNDEVKEKINIQYIKAWILEQQIAITTKADSILSRIEIADLNTMEYDYVLITGSDVSDKFIRLLEQGVKAHRIRTIQDIIHERCEVVSQAVYFNELCLHNMKRDGRPKVLMVSQDLTTSGAPVAFLNFACSLQRLGYGVQVYCQCNGPMREKFLKNGIPVYIEDLTKRNTLINWLHWEDFQFAVVNTILQYKLVEKFSQAQLNTLWWIHECGNYYNAILEVEGKLPMLGSEIYPVFVGNRVEEDFYQYFGYSLMGEELLYGLEDIGNVVSTQKFNRDKKIVFAMVGAVQYRKAQDIFIQAIDFLSEVDRKKCDFRIIGECAFDDNAIMQYIRNAEHRIAELEYINGLPYDDMQKAYEEIDVVVCPSRIDPMPVVVTEGLMRQKICLISDRIGTARYVEDGENGFVCRGGDAEDLAQKISHIINDWERLGDIGNRGREIYDKFFTMDKFESSVQRLVRKIKGEKKMIIFTSICSNYAHKARLLAESVKRNIPDARFIVCLTEREIPDAVKCEYFDEIILSKDMWKDNFEHFIFKHAIVEASTAVKGRCLQYLMETYSEEDKFIYLDPDCFVYSDFVELRELLDCKPIVVCPHLLQPGNIDMELSSTAHGIYNLGFLAVRRCEESQKFVDWWTDRLSLYCYDDIPRGIFTDQKWVDLAPCFFDVEIFKHKGYDFSIWSLMDCGLEEREGEFFVKGDPLRFIHFSGQGAMAEKCMRDWLPEGEHPFKKLYAKYDEMHTLSDSDKVSQTPWTYGTYDNGEPINDKIRMAYRDNISWLPIVNPFELNDLAIAEKMGIEDVLKPLEPEWDRNSVMNLISQFYDVWNSGKKVVFYGAGKYGKDFYDFCTKKNLEIEAFMVSNNSEQKEFCGVPVVSVEDNEFKKEDIVIVPTLKSTVHEEVYQTLMENGFKNIFKAVDKKHYDILHEFIKG